MSFHWRIFPLKIKYMGRVYINILYENGGGGAGEGGITVVVRRGYVLAHSVGRERSSSTSFFYAESSYI